MITFEEAQQLHDGLRYDGMYSPRATLKTTIGELSKALDQAIELLGSVEIIVLPWENASLFQQQWEEVPDLIKSVRDQNGRYSTDPWLWGYLCTYRGIDCLASGVVQGVIVSGVRDLRKSWAPEDRLVLIEVSSV